MNTFTENLKTSTNYKLTENGCLSHKSTLSKVYDMFAFGGAYRNRTEEDCIQLFSEALEENESLAIKCLFYLRDIRGGQGERRFFRVCFKWLARTHEDVAYRNIEQVSEFGRWDDLIYVSFDTPLQDKALKIIKNQLILDVNCKTPSLLAKWLPSENASSDLTKANGSIIRKYLGFTHKEYRLLLTSLREKIKIVETLMSQNRWDEIEFDKIPSRAGLIYKNAFARRDIIAKKYENFVKDENTTINAKDLYPYDIIRNARKDFDGWHNFGMGGKMTQTERDALQKMWENLPDYFEGNPAKMIAVVDTSGSMTGWGNRNVAPIDVAISLGLYCAERNTGDFANKFITFSTSPQFVETFGADIYQKAENIYKKSIVADTNLEVTFDLMKQAALKANPEDIPETIVVISDMEINYGVVGIRSNGDMMTLMERIREDWSRWRLKMPKLVYWNVDARDNTVLDLGPDVSYVSGCSPIIFQMVMTGKTGYDLMLEKLTSDRYSVVE